jgi:hypothetical protein
MERIASQEIKLDLHQRLQEETALHSSELVPKKLRNREITLKGGTKITEMKVFEAMDKAVQLEQKGLNAMGHRQFAKAEKLFAQNAAVREECQLSPINNSYLELADSQLMQGSPEKVEAARQTMRKAVVVEQARLYDPVILRLEKDTFVTDLSTLANIEGRLGHSEAKASLINQTIAWDKAAKKIASGGEAQLPKIELPQN